MAVPALLGLAALGGLIGKIVEKVIDAFFSRTLKKLLVFGTIIIAIGAAINLLLSFIGSQLKPLLSGLPPEIVGFLGAALPSNTSECLSAVVATQIACLTYSLTIKSLEVQQRIVS